MSRRILYGFGLAGLLAVVLAKVAIDDWPLDHLTRPEKISFLEVWFSVFGFAGLIVAVWLAAQQLSHAPRPALDVLVTEAGNRFSLTWLVKNAGGEPFQWFVLDIDLTTTGERYQIALEQQDACPSGRWEFGSLPGTTAKLKFHSQGQLAVFDSSGETIAGHTFRLGPWSQNVFSSETPEVLVQAELRVMGAKPVQRRVNLTGLAMNGAAPASPSAP